MEVSWLFATSPENKTSQSGEKSCLFMVTGTAVYRSVSRRFGRGAKGALAVNRTVSHLFDYGLGIVYILAFIEFIYCEISSGLFVPIQIFLFLSLISNSIALFPETINNITPGLSLIPQPNGILDKGLQ